MRLPPPPVQRLPWWPASAGPHPGGWHRGRRCWSLRFDAPPGPPLTHLLCGLDRLFDPARPPRVVALQQRRGGRWRLLGRWLAGEDPCWLAMPPAPVAGGASLRLVWSGRRLYRVLPSHALRRGGCLEAPRALAALGDAGLALPGERRCLELQQARLLARRPGAPLQALQLTWFGRFGNNLLQLANAVLLAEARGLAAVVLPRHPRFRLPAEGLGAAPRLLPAGAAAPGPRLLNRFFDLEFYWPAAGRPPDARYRATQSRLRPLLDPRVWQDTVAEDELVVHLRGGDVFGPGPVHPLYVQPPLAYYRLAVEDAARQGPLGRVRLVSEDRSNPCLEPLAEWLSRQGLAVALQTRDLLADLATLVAARRLVASNSTLVGAAALLSTRLETLWSFGTESMVIPGEPAALVAAWGVRHRPVLDAGGGYPRPGAWRNTPEQRALMLGYDAAQLSLPP